MSNLPGWRTKRKIVVIESDDWGSIRMPSLEVYHHLKQFGINIDKGDNKWFNTLDTLASKKDLEALFDTLCSVKDSNGKHPVITALSLCANPDFEKIQQEGFGQYYYEAFTSTLHNYNRSEAFNLWKTGQEAHLFWPEFHGREHINVKIWMEDLKRDAPHTMEAFKHRCWGFQPDNDLGISYQAAFDLDVLSTIDTQKGIIDSGLELFKKIHGRQSRYFVPPNGAIHQKIIDHAALKGIEYVSTPKIYKEPQGQNNIKKRFRYLGKRGKNNLRYITRNCFFEPTYHGKGFALEDCLNHINTAFRLRKPAVISTHRVNYVGGLKERNRINGNKSLGQLLKKIVQNWPEVEFMTSVQLGDLINQ